MSESSPHTDGWKKEAKKAIEARDKAKREAREAVLKAKEAEEKYAALQLKTKEFFEQENAQETLCRVLDFKLDPTNNVMVPDRLPTRVVSIQSWFIETAEKFESEELEIVRIDCSSKTIKAFRQIGVWQPGTGLYHSGSLGSYAPLDVGVHLDNRLKDKIRFYLSPIRFEEHKFPPEDLKWAEERPRIIFHKYAIKENEVARLLRDDYSIVYCMSRRGEGLFDEICEGDEVLVPFIAISMADAEAKCQEYCSHFGKKTHAYIFSKTENGLEKLGVALCERELLPKVWIEGEAERLFIQLHDKGTISTQILREKVTGKQPSDQGV